MTTRTLLALFVSLFVFACAPVDEVAPDGPEPMDEGDAEADDGDAGDEDATADDGWTEEGDEVAEDEPEEPTEEPEDDEESTEEPDEDEAWDASQPDLQAGDVTTFVVNCGFFQGSFEMGLRYLGDDEWEQAWFDAAMPTPELMPCAEGDSDADFEVDWTAEELFLSIGGLDHWLNPTDSENRWFGHVLPTTINPACQSGLESLGYADTGIPLTMELTDVGPPVL